MARITVETGKESLDEDFELDETGEEGGPRKRAIDADFCVGIEKALDKVTGWLEKRFVLSADHEGDATLELAQLGTGSTSPITTFTFSAGDDHTVLAEQIVDAAREDGDAIGRGICKYAVTERDAKGSRGRCAFLLQYKERDEEDIDEPPDSRGLVAQLMRHNEKTNKLMVDQMKVVTATTRGMMSMLVDENRQHRQAFAESRLVFGQMVENKAKIDIENMKAVKAEQRKDDMGAFLKTTVPHLLTQIAGRVAPQSAPKGAATLLEDQMYALLRTFSGDQLQSMLGLMTTEQQVAFLHTVQGFQERFERDQAAAEKHTNGTTGPAVQTPPTGQTDKDPALSGA